MAFYSPGEIIRSETTRKEYKLEVEVGQGSYGTVWQCMELSASGEPLGLRAVKIMVDEAVNTARTEVEILKLAGQHAEGYVPKFYEASLALVFEEGTMRDAEVFIIVMELIDGACLGHLCRVEGLPGADYDQGLPELIVRLAMADISSALAKLHEVGIVHRDVKGDNVLMSKDGRCYLCDFGTAAKDLDPDDDEPLQDCIGTPYFFAPEMAAAPDGAHYCELVDVWSLGMTVIQLYTGTPPLHRQLGDSASGEIVRNTVITEAAPDLREILGIGPMTKLSQPLHDCFHRDADMRCSAADISEYPSLGVSSTDRLEAGLWLQEVLEWFDEDE